MTIKKYPETVCETLGITPTSVMSFVPESCIPDGRNEEYSLFFNEYICNNTPLKDVPEITGLKESTVSAWASDLIGSMRIAIEKEYPSEDTEFGGTGFDIYEWAKKNNADYYDPHTGYIYLVQEYNRAVKLGMPTSGIRVVDGGRVIGVAKKL